MKAYKSYEVLAHEKEPVYSVKPASDIYDAIDLEIPDNLAICESETGEILITVKDGTVYPINDILTNKGEEPVLSWYDGTHTHTIRLQYKNI